MGAGAAIVGAGSDSPASRENGHSSRLDVWRWERHESGGNIIAQEKQSAGLSSVASEWKLQKQCRMLWSYVNWGENRHF